MQPIDFKEKTKVLQKPAGMTDEECQPLPVWNADGKTCISCWKASLIERIRFLFTGKIWLWVIFGHIQPPVCLDINYPFTKKRNNKYPYKEDAHGHT